MKRGDAGKDFVDRFFCRYLGKPFLFLGFQNREKIPVDVENKLVVEPDPVIAEPESFWCPFAFVSSIEEVLLELFFVDERWIFFIMSL